MWAVRVLAGCLVIAAAGVPAGGVAPHAGGASGGASMSPQELAGKTIARAVASSDPLFWRWQYGASIIMDYALKASYSDAFPGQDYTAFIDGIVDGFLTTQGQVGYDVLRNITMPWDSAVGDRIGLFPTVYLTRFLHNKTGRADDWTVATRVAQQYVLGWPLRLPDAAKSFSRADAWEGEPAGKEFVWADDQYMGFTLLNRLAIAGVEDAKRYVETSEAMHLDYAGMLQDEGQAGGPGDGLMYHGFNAKTGRRSCCKWSRANGWIMMAHVELLLALEATPGAPDPARALALFQSHAAAMKRVQTADGRWHQVLNETSTFLETSCTAMTLAAWATGVVHGWLPRADYDEPIHRAWAGLSRAVAANGTVTGICIGCGVLPSVEAYNAHPTDYPRSSPGLGSVFRAALAYQQYTAARQ